MIWADTTANHRLTPELDSHGHGDPGIVARTAYTTAHKTTWDRMVSGYLVTKAIAGGIMMMAALMIVLGHADEQAAVGVVPPYRGGRHACLTGGLLVGDLKQPKRFYYLLTKSNFDSWLVKGAYVLRRVRCTLCRRGSSSELPTPATPSRSWRFPTAILGAATAGYTAFLFGQCEGRDLWQTPLLLPMLLARAVDRGCLGLRNSRRLHGHPFAPCGLVGPPRRRRSRLRSSVWVELQSHGSRHVEMAIHDMTKGAQKNGSNSAVILGVLLPAAAMIIVLSNGDAELDQHRHRRVRRRARSRRHVPVRNRLRSRWPIRPTQLRVANGVWPNCDFGEPT